MYILKNIAPITEPSNINKQYDKRISTTSDENIYNAYSSYLLLLYFIS